MDRLRSRRWGGRAEYPGRRRFGVVKCRRRMHARSGAGGRPGRHRRAGGAGRCRAAVAARRCVRHIAAVSRDTSAGIGSEHDAVDGGRCAAHRSMRYSGRRGRVAEHATSHQDPLEEKRGAERCRETTRPKHRVVLDFAVRKDDGWRRSPCRPVVSRVRTGVVSPRPGLHRGAVGESLILSSRRSSTRRCAHPRPASFIDARLLAQWRAASWADLAYTASNDRRGSVRARPPAYEDSCSRNLFARS